MPDKAEPDESTPPDEGQSTSDADETTLAREQMEEALREKEQFRAMAQRAQADLVNYRRRAEDERRELRRGANSELLLKVLSIVDDLERATALVPDDAVAPGWLEGLQLIQRNLENLLTSQGVTGIEAEGKPFEPWQHEAVLYEESSDGKEGVVMSVVRKGYKLHDRVLRPAQVAVSKATQPEAQDENTDLEEE